MALFYRGIVFLLFVTSFLATGLLYIKKTHGIPTFTYRDVIVSSVVFFCITLVWFTHLPVTADRSLSVFLLSYMNTKSGNVVTPDELSRVMVDTYFGENQALKKRLDEQITLGTIVKTGDGYVMTGRGKLLMRLYVWMTDVFRIDKNNVLMH